MSNNSQDEPDEYAIIFDGPNSNSTEDTKIEVSDAEPESESPSEYIDAAVDETDAFMKDHQSDAEDEDIEEGIFAPVRKTKSVGKKTASLMWAVSLLAFVGVGAFVYVANPNILSKVTNNLVGGEDVTLPNDGVTADTTSSATDVTATEPVSEVDPNLHAADNSEAIKPDAIAQDGTTTDIPTNTTDPTVASTAPADISATPDVPVTGTPPVAAVAPTTDLLTPEQKPADTSAAVTVAPTVAPNTAIVAAQSDAQATTTAVAPTPAATNPETSTAAVAPSAEAIATSSPHVAETTAAKPPVETAPSSDVITPTNDKDDTAEESQSTDTEQSATTPSTVAAPVVEASSITAKDSKSTVAPKDGQPVIVASKEEKKVLDDANLDKYFDSPNGKMLKDIPAPSMDPRKGSRESIIVVNKKGKRTNTDSSKPAAPISIETTSLNTQMVSANRAMKLGRYDAAKEMYDDLYKLNPRDAQILSGRAVLLQ